MKQCKQCGKEINWRDRSDKKFCDATCRKQWNRTKKEGEKICKEIKYKMNRLYLTLKRNPQSRTDETIQQMKSLREELDFMLQMYHAETMRERAARNELVAAQRRKRSF